MVPVPAATASPENLLKCKFSEQETLGAVGSNPYDTHSSVRANNPIRCFPHIHLHHLEEDHAKMQIPVHRSGMDPRVCISAKLQDAADSGATLCKLNLKSTCEEGEQSSCG